MIWPLIKLISFKAIGNLVGEFLEVDLTYYGQIGYSNFLRIRINVFIKKPLCPEFHSKKPDGNISWVTIKYEKMPDLCYKCRVMGHLNKICIV